MNKADLPGIISSPRKPNIIQFLFTLKDEIDCSVMYDAMQKTIKRYPYFAFRIVRTENGYDKIENQLPIIVMDSFSDYKRGALSCQGCVPVKRARLARIYGGLLKS